MDALQVIAPLVGVLLGSTLSGVAAYVRIRNEKKRVIAIALADLLEVRHHLIGIEVVIQEMRRRMEVPAEGIAMIRELIDSLAPVDESVHKRYDDAISLLAGIDPVLAFVMRSKNTLPKVRGTLRAITTAGDAKPEFTVLLESGLMEALTPSLNEAALKLARAHSFRTGRQVKKLIETSAEIPPQLSNFFDQMKTLVESQDGISAKAT